MSDHDHAHAHAHDHDHEEHHGGSIRLYVSVALALLVLTFMSYLTYTPMWPFGDSVGIKRLWMMAVSCTKAMLVIMFFMHLKWEANWKWVLTVPASMMSIFLVLVLVPDVGWRMRYASPQRMIYAAESPAAAASQDHDHDTPPKPADPKNPAR
jgi:cytochrome c oxidase subunit 4